MKERTPQDRNYYKLYYLRNRDRLKQGDKAYYEKNREAVLAKRKEWHQKNRPKVLANVKAWKRANRDKVSACYKRNYLKRKAVVYGHYGAYCHCCYETKPAFLSIDHINNDGSIERRKGIMGDRLLQRLIKAGFPSDYTILCMNCNWAKRLSGICPHREEAKK